ncbi:unnamed protein product [Brassica oleracea var. botrytis]
MEEYALNLIWAYIEYAKAESYLTGYPQEYSKIFKRLYFGGKRMLRLPAQLDWGCRRGFDMEGDQLDDINTNQLEAQEDQVTRKKFLMVGTILIGGKYKKKVTGGKTHVQAAKQEW